MNLKSYYKSIPFRTAPRDSFTESVAEQCGVTKTTVRNWCKYGIKPREFAHVKILSEITGISEDELWDD